MRFAIPGALLLSVAIAPVLLAQGRVIPDDDWCRHEGDWGDDRERVCEVREITIPAGRQTIAVDAEPNGGIRVVGWDRDEILIRAKVVANARSEERAQEISQAVRILTDGTIRSDGPDVHGRNQWWSVSYEVSVPARSNLDLDTHNGGIAVEGVEGTIAFRTSNGGVSLSRLAGSVRGRTTNGSVTVNFDGDQWQGDGLDVSTTNGGIRLEIPADYSARLETGTTNGRIRADFPLTVQGRINRNIRTDLGSGGRLIRVMTTNGSVTLQRPGTGL